MNYPMNIWIVNEDDIDRFTTTGGKIIYIVDQPDPRYRMHPALVSAGILLPPIEAINNELDGKIPEAAMIYESYLMSQEVYQYIIILVAAAVLGNPIGILFGKDELNMQFPKIFIDFLYKQHGLVIGIDGKINPYIQGDYMNLDLAILYTNNIIDYKTFMERHPSDAPILYHLVMDKLNMDVKPPVSSYMECVNYFDMSLNNTKRNGNRILIDPLVSDV